MRKHRISYYGLISLLLIVTTSCSKMEMEQEVKGASETDLSTRADLVEYTLHVETAGTLDSLVEAGTYSDAQKLIVTGNIAYEDVNYVDVNMPTVEVLDLAGSEYESESIEGAFLSDSTKIKEISLPGNITTIRGTSGYDKNDQYYSFYPFECDSLISITIPESVTDIGWRAFLGCSSLTSIHIPEGVEHIGSEAFHNCSSLASIYLPEGLITIQSAAFSGCSSLTDIHIPETVNYISIQAFEACTSLTNINIPENMTSIEYKTFGGCSSLTNIDIPQSVTSIGSRVFIGCSSLTSIDIPQSVTSIGSRTFEDCTSLTSITLPKSLTSSYIGEYTFRNCTSLTSITIPEGVTSIGEAAFYNCKSLANIYIPESVKSIEESAFSGCSSLTCINIPENVKSMGGYAFNGCSSLTSINIPENVKSMGDYAFNGCSSLTSINIPKGLKSIGIYTFYDCASLTNITIPESVTSFGEAAFANCSAISCISIPESVTSIGKSAFWNCSSLTSINIPEGIKSIEEYTFGDCSSLTNITIPESVTSIGKSAFLYCSSLTSINIPKSVTNIGESAFEGCSAISCITIPENVKSLGSDVFSGCNSLQKVICYSAGDINDLSNGSNLDCWLIINRPNGDTPIYGPNWKNVAINGVAESVILPYNKEVNLVIPEEVKFIKKISYTMNFDTYYHGASYGIWRTITLPFTPTSITHAEKGRLAPFDSEEKGAKNFWLRELTTDGFKDVTQIEPNHPYIIAMPDSPEYADKYNLSGYVTFSAENLDTEAMINSTPLSTEGTDYTMYASYSYIDNTDDIYVLNNNQFVSNSGPVYPYEAYLKANTATLRSVVSLSKGRVATRASGESNRKPKIDDM